MSLISILWIELKIETSIRKSSDLGLMIIFHFSRWHRNHKSILSLYIEENDYQSIIDKLFRWTMLCMKYHHRRMMKFFKSKHYHMSSYMIFRERQARRAYSDIWSRIFILHNSFDEAFTYLLSYFSWI